MPLTSTPELGLPTRNTEYNECTKSANPRCLHGHCTELKLSQHACPSSFVSGYIHDNFEMKLT